MFMCEGAGLCLYSERRYHSTVFLYEVLVIEPKRGYKPIRLYGNVHIYIYKNKED
jgi:hypothetical protein